MGTLTRTFLLGAVASLAFIATDGPAAQAQTKAKAPAAPKPAAGTKGASTGKTAAKTGGSSTPTPGAEFKKAGESAENYEKAGQAAGAGGAALGRKTADGDLAGGAVDFGKGMGTMGKEVGVGTAKVGASVGRGIGRVFTPRKTAAKDAKN
jgi:hypothetical protein